MLLSDFDRTIVNIDTAAYALDLFADPSWKNIENRFERGELGFEESIREEFAMIKAPQELILQELDQVVNFRPNFEKLVDYCRAKSLPFTVVSAGLKFSIHHFLDRNSWLKLISIHAPEAAYTGQGYRLVFPKLFDESSANFKQDLVRHYRKLGNTVYYIGDGLGDFPAAREAELRFAIEGSMLAKKCRAERVSMTEITDFQQVIDGIDDFTN
jgi:2-hydroxy-3-keto-5-methylthiopentenyl-1-phosphate phosphatase